MQTLKRCPFCSKPLAIRGGVNPYGQCDTDGCWMMEAKISIVCDDPRQVERWNTRPAAPVEGLETVKSSPAAGRQVLKGGDA